MNKSTLSLTLFLLTLIAISSFLMLSYTSKPNSKQHADKKTIDSFVMQANITEYSMTGNIENNIKSPTIYHYKKSNISYFSQPDILSYNEKSIPWHITADYGYHYHDSNKIDLKNNVVIYKNKDKSKNQSAVTIKSNSMSYFPEKSIMSSKEHVNISRDNNEINGLGLRANLKTNIIKLLSQSTGIYKPKPDASRKQRI